MSHKRGARLIVAGPAREPVALADVAVLLLLPGLAWLVLTGLMDVVFLIIFCVVVLRLIVGNIREKLRRDRRGYAAGGLSTPTS